MHQQHTGVTTSAILVSFQVCDIMGASDMLSCMLD